MQLTRPNWLRCWNWSASGWAATPVGFAFLEGFIGSPAYGIDDLRQDLNRFMFLLGGSDGETLFGP
jgi:hypothetical protein